MVVTSPGNDSTTPLAGLGVVVTRPAHQATPLCQQLAALGARPIRFPTLAILEPRNPAAIVPIIERLEHFQLAIFSSVNAVTHGVAQIRARRAWPDTLARAAIGAATARALAGAGLPATVVPRDDYSSEGLLALAALQRVAGSAIVIFRGEGGRRTLGDTLRKRGAEIHYAEVYRRGRPATDAGRLREHWQRDELQVIISTSNEGLQNLLGMVDANDRPRLLATPLLVVSTRGRELARELGFQRPPLLAARASDEAIIETLLQWRRQQFQ